MPRLSTLVTIKTVSSTTQINILFYLFIMNIFYLPSLSKWCGSCFPLLLVPLLSSSVSMKISSTTAMFSWSTLDDGNVLDVCLDEQCWVASHFQPFHQVKGLQPGRHYNVIVKKKTSFPHLQINVTQNFQQAIKTGMCTNTYSHTHIVGSVMNMFLYFKLLWIKVSAKYVKVDISKLKLSRAKILLLGLMQ